MAVNFSTGAIDYNMLYAMQNGQGVQTEQGYQTASNPISYQNDSYNFSSSNCTDGKDDGKIGLFSALGNATLGIGKTIVNGVKGMFTDKNGNFSLGKTLLSAATVAACIAFPAVGVAACVIGGTMGAVQVGKGIYNAATADTDAEAKQAWQDIGGGAFTVATSAVGAKAGVKAVKATSTAGTNGASALSSLDDAATTGQKLSALGKDMVSSSKNQFSTVKNSATSYTNAAKVKYAEVKAAKIKNTGTLTPDELHTINNAKYQRMFANDDTLAALDKIDDVSNAVKNFTQSETGTKVINAAKHPIETAKQFASTETGTKVINAAKHPIETAKQFASTETGTKVLNAAKHPIKTSQQAWTAMKSKVNAANFKDISSQLTGKAKSIYAELQNGNSTYAQVVQEYGYENVAQVLEYVIGATYGMEQV